MVNAGASTTASIRAVLFAPRNYKIVLRKIRLAVTFRTTEPTDEDQQTLVAIVPRNLNDSSILSLVPTTDAEGNRIIERLVGNALFVGWLTQREQGTPNNNTLIGPTINQRVDFTNLPVKDRPAFKAKGAGSNSEQIGWGLLRWDRAAIATPDVDAVIIIEHDLVWIGGPSSKTDLTWINDEEQNN